MPTHQRISPVAGHSRPGRRRFARHARRFRLDTHGQAWHSLDGARHGRLPVSPLAPKSVPDMPAIAGVRLATAAAGISYREPHRRAAGAARRPAPRWPACSPARNARRRRSSGAAPSSRAARPRALVVNSGNANAFTGKTGRAGLQVHRRDRGASAIGCKPDRHLPRLDRRDRRAARRRRSSTA